MRKWGTLLAHLYHFSIPFLSSALIACESLSIHRTMYVKRVSPCRMSLVGLNFVERVPFQRICIVKEEIQCMMSWIMLSGKCAFLRVSSMKSHFNPLKAFSRFTLMAIKPIFPVFFLMEWITSWVMIILSIIYVFLPLMKLNWYERIRLGMMLSIYWQDALWWLYRKLSKG